MSEEAKKKQKKKKNNCCFIFFTLMFSTHLPVRLKLIEQVLVFKISRCLLFSQPCKRCQSFVELKQAAKFTSLIFFFSLLTSQDSLLLFRQKQLCSSNLSIYSRRSFLQCLSWLSSTLPGHHSSYSNNLLAIFLYFFRFSSQIPETIDCLHGN